MLAKWRKSPWLLFAAAVIVVYALIRVASLSPVFTLDYMFSYYQTYEHGYVHRGLIGTLVKFFFGFVPINTMAENSIAVEGILRFVNVLFLSALLIPPILSSDSSSRTKWLLMAATAAVLLSPGWKWSALIGSFLDKHVYFFALLAVTALVFRRPLLFCVACVLALLMHPAYLFYCFILACMALYTIWRFNYKRPWLWTFAAICPLAVFVAGLLLHNNEAALATLKDLPVDAKIHELFRLYITGNKVGSAWPVVVRFSIFPSAILLNILFFGVPALVIALILTWLLPWQSAEDEQAKNAGVMGAVKRFFVEGRWVFLLAAGTPILAQFFTTDIGRMLNWTWWGLGLGLIYYVRLCAPNVAPSTARQPHEKTKKRRQRRRTTPQRTVPFNLANYQFSLVIGAFAFVQAGMPPIGTHLAMPNILAPCFRLCALSIHSPGEVAARYVTETLRDAIFPFQASAAQVFHSRFIRPEDMEPKVKLEGDVLSLANGYKGEIFREKMMLHGDTPFTFTLLHDDTEEAAPQLVIASPLFKEDAVVEPEITDDEKIVWRGKLPPAYGEYRFKLRFDNEDRGEFRLKEIHMAKR